MSIAKAIRTAQPNKLDWFDVEDENGRRYRYRRVGGIDVAEVAQVEGHFSRGHPIRASLIRDHNGHPLLQQDADGLPPTIVVEHVDDPTSPLLSILGLPGKEEFTLVS